MTRWGIRLASFMLLSAGFAVAAPQTVTAQDVFDQVIYELAMGYNGPSNVKASELRRKYLPELQKACVGKPTCAPDHAYPVIRNVLKEVGDAHTNFFTPTQLEEVGKLFAGEKSERKSFGVVTQALGTGGRVVLEVLPQSPAAQTGWRVGDVLTKVNGVALDAESGAEALRRVSRGSPATFDIKRQGTSFKTTLTAMPLVVPPVTLTTNAGVTVLRLRHFNVPGVAQKVHAAITKLNKEQPKGLILDLRYNSGGRVEEFLLSAGAFTQPAPLYLTSRIDTAKINYVHGKYAVNDAVQSAVTIKSPTRYVGPLVILVDRDTASSAEFLARSLMSRPCTTVIGEETAGVGDTATRFIELPDGSGLQLTFAQVLDANKQKLGERVKPQQEIDLRPLTIAAQGKDAPLMEGFKVLEGLQACSK